MKRKYEIGFVINPESSEEEVKKIVDMVVQIIEKSSGKVENIDEWGRKKFAYPIQSHGEGIYVFVNAEAAGTVFNKVEKKLKITEKVLRFIILRLDDKLKRANRMTKKWKRMEKLNKKTVEEGEAVGEVEEFEEGKEVEDEKS